MCAPCVANRTVKESMFSTMSKVYISQTVLCTHAIFVRLSFILKMPEMFMYQEIIETTINVFNLKFPPYLIQIYVHSGKESDRSILHQYIKKENGSGRTLFVCSLCGKSNAQKSNLMNHVESVHFPNLFTYSCKYCGKVYNAKNSLNVHMSTSHREEKTYQFN